jgi:hypothetical protein
MLTFANLSFRSENVFWICCYALAVALVILIFRRTKLLTLALAAYLGMGLMWGELAFSPPEISLGFGAIPLTGAIALVLSAHAVDRKNRHCKPALAVLIGGAVLILVLDRLTHGTGTIPIGLALLPLAAAIIIVDVAFLQGFLHGIPGPRSWRRKV